MLIRHADPQRDASGCAAIYAPFVDRTAVSFEETAPDAAEFARRITKLSATHAFLVAEDERGVAGFAYGGPHRQRAAYRWSTEVSVYIDERVRRQGLARALYGQLMPLLSRQGLWIALAGITLPNEPSVALHEACGFTPVGVYSRIGFKQGEWQDVGWWQLPLQDGEGPPTEVAEPARLPGPVSLP